MTQISGKIKINKAKPWRKIILVTVTVALLLLGVYRVVQSLSSEGRAKPAPLTQIQFKPSEITEVNPAPFAQTLPLSGALNPYVQATVSARAAGEVRKVLVREGQSVRQGDTLAVLDNTNYQAQFDQAVANESSAQASLQLAQQDFDNNSKLVKEGFISPIALQKIQVTLASARSQLENAKQAKVIAQRALSEVKIKAPVSGVISSRKLSEGETVAVGASMFEIVNTDVFELQAPVSAEQIGLIRSGQTVELTSNGIAQAFNGVVERINPAASNGSRSYTAYIRVENPEGILKAGMFAQGKIVIDAREAIITVPATALHSRDQAQYVYVIDDGKLAERAVTTGARASDAIDAQVEVVSGLNPNDKVVRLDFGAMQVGVNAILLNADGTAPVVEKKAQESQSWWQKIIGVFKAKG